MPIFKPGEFQSASKARKSRLEKALVTRAETDGYSNVVRRKKSFEWITQAKFSDIDKSRKGGITSAINYFAKRKSGAKVNVLDWGCGDGTAAKELAKDLRVNVFGFAIDSSREWIKPSNVTFLHTAVEILPKFLRRKKLVFDVIYSEAAIKHMPVDYQVSHLCELSRSLSVGGRIFPDPIRLDQNIRKLFESSRLKVEEDHNFLVSLTKVK